MFAVRQSDAAADVSRTSRWVLAATKKYPYRKGASAVATQVTADDRLIESACAMEKMASPVEARQLSKAARPTPSLMPRLFTYNAAPSLDVWMALNVQSRPFASHSSSNHKSVQAPPPPAHQAQPEARSGRPAKSFAKLFESIPGG
jgi:hypothetical protein